MADQTVRIKLREQVLDQGIRNTNFFNGRLLTAADLKTEQDADRKHRAQLGQAVGDGVVAGLEVTLLDDGSASAAPVVRVSGGLALNRCGQVLALPTTVEVALSSQADPTPADAGLFAACRRPPSAPGTDRGVFVLVLGPSSGYREQAPRRGLGTDDGVKGCGPRYAVEGVSFRLETLDPSDLAGESPAIVAADLEVKDLTDPASLSLHRNLLAHLCFGTEPLASFPTDPFRAGPDGQSPFEAYGAVDSLRVDGRLTDCEVPLALIFWPSSGVKFVDAWSVRRRVIQPWVGDPWPLQVGQRRLAEAEAVFLQFQDQIRDMLDGPGPGSVSAISRFRILPPAGYLPVGNGQYTLNAFFTALTVNTQTLDTAFLRLLMQQSWYLDPIDLESPPSIRVCSPQGEPGYLLFVRDENVFAPPPNQPQPRPPSGPTPTTGRMDILVSVVETDAVPTTGRLLRKPGALETSLIRLGIEDRQAVEAPVRKNRVSVRVLDSLGKEYPVENVSLGAGKLLGRAETIVFHRGVARYAAPSLPAGDYTVSVKALGFKPAEVPATVATGQSKRVGVVLVPDTGKPGGPTRAPSLGQDVSWVNPGWYGKAYVVDSHLRWPWPPEPDASDKFNTVVDPPPPGVDAWVEGWVDHLRDEFPDAPIDPGGARLVVSRTHSPEVVADEPYAFIVFGDNGAYVPVVLTALNQALDRPVALSDVDLPGVRPAEAERFRDLGVTSLDMLAAGWTGLVGEALGVGPEAAGSLLSTARDRVATLQGTLRVFSGVDATLEQAMKGVGIDGPTALANADPQNLVATLGAGVLNLTLANLLVDEARGVVPSSQWSLDSPQAGLKDHEIAALRAQGISTLGALLDKTKDDAGRADVGKALGVSPARVGTLFGGVSIASAASLAEARLRQTAVTNLIGIDRDTGLALARLGLAHAGSLATADPAVLASAFGGDVRRAGAAILAARNLTGLV